MIDEKETERLIAIVRSEIDLSSDPNEEEVKVLIAQTVYRETIENNYSYKDRDDLVKSYSIPSENWMFYRNS